MTEVDRWIISKVEAFSHWTQQWFGIHSARWERLLLCMALLQVLLIDIPRHWGDTFRSTLDGVLIVYFVGRFIVSLGRTPCVQIERTGNPNKLVGQYTRVLSAVISVSLLVTAIRLWIQVGTYTGSLWFECSTLAYYFGACDDLPWRPARAREMLQAFWLPPQPSEAL